MSTAPITTGSASIGARLRDAFRRTFGTRPSPYRAAALKERVYATLTGLAIVTTLTLDGHHAPADAMVTLAAGVIGITGAGVVAEVIAHQVGHGTYPAPRDLARMLRIAIGALTSAALPLVVLTAATLGLLQVGDALLIAITLYFFALVLLVLIAARRTQLSWRQQLTSIAVLAGAGLVAVMVLVLGH
ncbi:hypothetical protein [Microbacterium sp.]|uniref:hypothetical protein n=1 Tax=Microbacterium sp. TaxID=51671 RepID=UPI0028113BCC|nr:hypothetical protein [Microbacterium sp.]